MATHRRDFLKVASGTLAAAGAARLAPWTIELAAAQAAVADAVRHDVADAALAAAAKLGASYADVRIIRLQTEAISTREQQVQNVARNQSFGFGIRVLVRGTWGFAASPFVSVDEARRAAQAAVEIARANAQYQRKPIVLAPVDVVKTSWKGAFTKDPFEVALDDKIQFLLKLNAVAMKTKGVSFVNSSMSWLSERRFLATSDGSRIEQHLVRGQPAFSVTAVNSATGDFQTRDSYAGPQGMGYEYIDSYPWEDDARRAGEEAVMKLTAKSVAPGRYDLVLHPSHLWLTIHESVGHSTELDRALWWEANYAGTSFLKVEDAGKLKFGSPIVNFVADRTQPAGLATVGFDEEGVPAQRWHLVKNGIFVDWQTTRDLAPQIGRKTSYGCLHTESWASVPFPRMPNVSLEPASGTTSLDDLVAGVDRGILIMGDGSFSIDQQRYNFQFGGQTFWEIQKGKVAGMLRDVAYQSRTTDFWGACDGLGGQDTYRLEGAFNDGKGEPTQINAVSHGCPVARFRGINVLNTGVEA
jgi:TldD protein